MWILIWVLLAGFVIGVYGWTTAILIQQKKAWKDLAARMKLVYTPGKFSDPPAVSGMIGQRRVSLFTSAQPTPDARGQRFVTTIEIGMGPGMPTAAALATPEYASFLSGLRMTESMQPDFPDWKPEYIVRTRDGAALRAYLTPERLKTLQGIFAMKNSIALFFFDELDAVLRIETSDPLRNADRMAKMIKSLTAALDRLSPTEAEKQAGAERAAAIKRDQAAQEAVAAAALAAARAAAAEAAALPAAPLKDVPLKDTPQAAETGEKKKP